MYGLIKRNKCDNKKEICLNLGRDLTYDTKDWSETISYKQTTGKQ